VQIRLGKFDDFKSGDKVLLSGRGEDIHALSGLLAEFVASGDDSIAIHTKALVSPRHPVRLFAVASSGVLVDGHAWLCTAESLPEISGKLGALGTGHHYFGLLRTNVELLVSVGEYDLAWWQAQG
jgi:hypothetical protein